MGREIERKYLLRPGAWTAPPTGGVTCIQGYVPGCTTGVVRVRLMGDDAFLTLKASFTPVTRAEYEYAIPPARRCPRNVGVAVPGAPGREDAL